jgi:hypothetical protein
MSRGAAIKSRSRRNERPDAAGVDWRSHFSHYLGRPLLQAGPIVFGGCVVSLLFVAWLNRDEGHLTAESGAGYWLGIVGAVIMLMLVAYPFRKRLRILNRVGRVSSWFRLHMVFGIIGPTLVILHTNFNLGSLNSRLALLTMLIVVTSGIIGRYLYAKVHRGLYGQQAELRDILADIAALKTSLGQEIAGLPALVQRLESHAERVAAKRGFAGAFISGPRTALARRSIARGIESAIAASPAWRSIPRRQRRAYVREINQRLRLFFAAVRKAERLALFEWLFSMWHHLHLPLFVMLAVSVVIHIVAVHRY